MRTDTLILALNDVRDPYIEEYASLKHKKKSLHTTWKKWVSIAACFALVLFVGSVLFAHFGRSGMDDPRGGVYYEFQDYNELCSILPDGNILVNLQQGQDADIKCSGSHKEELQTSAVYGDFYHIFIDLEFPDGRSISLICEVELDQTAKEYVEARPLKYPDEAVDSVRIGSTNVYFAEFENSQYAVFNVGSDLYEFAFTSFTQDEILTYITNLLNG